ncbi:MAG: tetratricopeptide repeat protein [Planctomycetes bacterium]|nr:tetratricopeptide repeat protein [Planctomycetota bacterium]
MSTPDEVLACNQRGIAEAREGRWDGAAEWFRKAIEFMPEAPAAHNNLGNVYFFQGKLAEAVTCYRRSLQLLPDDPHTLNNLGNTLRQLDQLDEAISCGRQAIALQPSYAQAYSNLSIALLAKGELDEALLLCRQALQLQPEFAEAHNNTGLILQRLERWDEAATSFREALRLRPDLVEAHISLANLCWRNDLFDEAIAHCDEILRLKPSLGVGHTIYGAVLFKLGRFDEARARFDQAIRVQPDLAEAHFNRAQLWLQRGDFQEGWREYRWRWKCKDFVVRASQRPYWDGSPLAGKTILLCVEQGLGDTMQFIRYAPRVKQQAARVILACSKALIPLLSRAPGIDQVVAQDGDIPKVDTHVPLLNLPYHFKTTLDTIPKRVPYLFADETLVARWRGELTAFPGFKVGIAWKGGIQHPLDKTRSISLDHFAPLAQDGVHLLSLQKGPGTEQLEAINGRFTVANLGRWLDEASGAFMDTAAVMKGLDLIITADTSIAHLAGSLGVPVWVALAFVADWRWLLDRDDSPWYPTMRLFRQNAPGNWEDVFARMAAELALLVKNVHRPLSVPIEISPGELIDKITILEIKRARITDSAKLANVIAELGILAAARDRTVASSPQLTELTAAIRKVNEALWEVEDAIRVCERSKNFGPGFIDLARSVYRHNDHRADIKRQINELLGSKLIEEKSYSN